MAGAQAFQAVLTVRNGNGEVPIAKWVDGCSNEELEITLNEWKSNIKKTGGKVSDCHCFSSHEIVVLSAFVLDT